MSSKALWYGGLAAAALLCGAVYVHAQTISADEIVEKANHAAFYQGGDGKAHVTMTITDAQGRERNREFYILRWDQGDDAEQKYYVYFKKPADVRNMVFMVWKHIDADDDRWLYLPALDLVKRISTSDKRTSFVGSDFLYEDVSGRNIHDDTHELASETEKYYILKNIPKDPSTVEFDYYNVFVDKTTFLPVKIEYYDDKDYLYRRIEALEIRDVQGFPTVMKSKASNFKTGSFTITEFKTVKYDVGLDASIFTERYLRQPPRRWLR